MKNIYQITLFIAAFSILLCMSHETGAQSRHVTASSLGLGGGGTAYLDSYHANFVNPANLMLNEGERPRFSIGLLGGLSTTVGGSLLNTTVYNDYFTRGLLVSGDLANEALDKWFGGSPGNMRNMGMQLDFIPLGMAYRGKRWAVSAALRTRLLLDSGMSRGLAEMGIYGLDGDVFSEPRPVNFGFEALSLSEVSVGYSRKLFEWSSLFGIFKNVKLYAGGAPKVLLGGHSTRLEFTSTFQVKGESENRIELIRHDFQYTLETTGSLAEQLDHFYRDRRQSGATPDIDNYVEQDGNDMFGINAVGWGLDLGATVEAEFSMPVVGAAFKGPERLRVGLSLTDLGALSFKNPAQRFTADNLLEWRGFELDRERIENEFNGNRDEYIEYVLVDSIATEVYGSFVSGEGTETLTRFMPAMLNIGAHLTLHRLSLSMDLGKGFLEKGINSRRVSLATGIEYRLFGFMPFRAGLRTGGFTSTSYSAGFGLEFANFEFSLAASMVRRALNRGFNAGAAWSGLVFRF